MVPHSLQFCPTRSLSLHTLHLERHATNKISTPNGVASAAPAISRGRGGGRGRGGRGRGANAPPKTRDSALGVRRGGYSGGLSRGTDSIKDLDDVTTIFEKLNENYDDVAVDADGK